MINPTFEPVKDDTEVNKIAPRHQVIAEWNGFHVHLNAEYTIPRIKCSNSGLSPNLGKETCFNTARDP
jgi:hypothetical protein